jgi:hypothetical protein
MAAITQEMGESAIRVGMGLGVASLASGTAKPLFSRRLGVMLSLSCFLPETKVSRLSNSKACAKSINQPLNRAQDALWKGVRNNLRRPVVEK